MKQQTRTSERGIAATYVYGKSAGDEEMLVTIALVIILALPGLNYLLPPVADPDTVAHILQLPLRLVHAFLPAVAVLVSALLLSRALRPHLVMVKVALYMVPATAAVTSVGVTIVQARAADGIDGWRSLWFTFEAGVTAMVSGTLLTIAWRGWRRAAGIGFGLLVPGLLFAALLW